MSGEPLIAVVTGAGQGLGRGIARALGSKGATVFLTGRDSAGTLSLAADEVTRNGGRGIAIKCDHRDDDAVAAVFDQVRETSGRLDILVNNAAAVHVEALTAAKPFWEKPLCIAEMMDVGLRTNYIASYYAAPLMLENKRGLIASISFYGAVSYFHGAAYGAAKAGTDKMMFDMAVDLRPRGVSAVSIWPGFILTEMILAMTPEQMPPDLAAMLPLFETPEFTGLVIEALYRDPELANLSGQALIGAELGERYGIADADGKHPVSFRETLGAPARMFVAKAEGAA